MHTPCDTDILLVTHPKVGTTWTKAILFALKNRMHYPDLQEHPLLTNIPHDLVPLLEGDIYTKKKVLDLDPAFPRLISTHLPYALLPTSVKDSTCKIVYVYRNPKNTFVSLWHFQNRLYPTTNSLEEAFDKFCRGMNPFGSYWDHVLSCWKESIQNPGRKMLFLKYEEMKEQTTTYLKRIVEFLDCPFSLEEEAKGTMNDISRLCSFDNLSNLDVNKSGKRHLPDHKMTLFRQCIDSAAYFHQGNTGDWVNFLTPKMAEKLDHIIEEKFHGTGLKL
ncbi:cytosolic sulfotransferase 5-like [Carya illinoinensis]|uniref:cytosolic sulfotransferase 5-like n=1 Tax=Carya illinoinensis TaxID=32201 RepID=UPI001C7251FD|nr:cytosolic sulfotransferase 5-like [Carya illinoinensis]